MSLKSFHLLFIASSLGLFAFVVNWSLRQMAAGNDHAGFAALGAAGFAAGLVYLGWFVKKYSRLK